MIEDTSFIIDILPDDEDALTFLELLEKERLPEKISSITVFELYEGFELSSASEDRRRSVLNVLDTKHVVDADATMMRRAGQLSGGLSAGGRRSIERTELSLRVRSYTTNPSSLEPPTTSTASTDSTCERTDVYGRSLEPAVLEGPVKVPSSGGPAGVTMNEWPDWWDFSRPGRARGEFIPSH